MYSESSVWGVPRYTILPSGLSIRSNSSTFSRIFSRCTVVKAFSDPEVQACYGDLVYVKRDDISKTVRYWKSGEFKPEKFYHGWMPPHPTFFVRRSVYEQCGLFNLELGSAADYEMMLRLLFKQRIKAVYIPEVLVHMRSGGVSNASVGNRLQANRMDRKAWTVNGLRPYPWTLWAKPIRKLRQWVVGASR